MTTATLDNCYIQVKPSKALRDYIKGIKNETGIPPNISNFQSKKPEKAFKEHKLLINKTDREFIESLNLSDIEDSIEVADCADSECTKLLYLEDLHWIKDFIDSKNQEVETKVHFNELFNGSTIVLPENKQVPRNPELEKRCLKLKAQQENRAYKAMTKNIDNVRLRHPEDTIAYQMKQINSQLIAIFQFIVSVLAGFAFGFIGIEVFVGTLDFGFRLLLGIMSALIVALAELYFLAKKLNEDMEFESKIKEKVN